MGGRAANAAFYPPKLISKILRGMRDTADAEELDEVEDVAMKAATNIAGCLHDVPACTIKAAYEAADLNHKNAQRKVKFKFLDGSTKLIDLDPHFQEVYKDEYTTEQLPREQTKAAIYDELAYFCDHVFRGVSYEEAVNDPDGKIIGSRWVNCNKGDQEAPDVRCRLVAQR